MPRRLVGSVLATVVSVAFAAVFIARHAFDLTLQWDEWSFFSRFDRLPRPQVWFEPFNGHVKPLYFLLIDLERALLGPVLPRLLVVSLALHAVCTFLLAELLRARLRSALAATLAALAFGLASSWRGVLWSASHQCTQLCFAVTAAGMLALVRSRGETRAWLGAPLAALVAPLTFGAGLSAGPALALEAWLFVAPERRRRVVGSIVAAWLVAGLVYFVFGRGQTAARLPHDGRTALMALAFLVEGLGLGFVHQVPRLPVAQTVGNAAILSGAWLGLVLLLAARVGTEGRRWLLATHGYLVAYLVPMALTRWTHVFADNPNGASPHYQYLPALAWTTVLGLAIARAEGRSRTAVIAVAAALLPFIAIGHARDAAADPRFHAPAMRRALRHVEIVASLRERARAARGPIWNAPLPGSLAWPDVRARELLLVVEPTLAPVWTDVSTKETRAPWAADPLLAAALALPRD